MQPMEDVYQRHAQVVYRYLVSLTHDADLAEELTQETFYQAIRSSERFDGSCKVSTWLCGIARNVLRTYRRRHPETFEVQRDALTEPSAETEALRTEDRLELMRLLHGLEDPYREVIYLRIFGELSFAEVGEVLDKSETWARVTFYRGKEKLKKAGAHHD